MNPKEYIITAALTSELFNIAKATSLETTVWLRRTETFLDETAQLIERFSRCRRRLIFALQTLHADQLTVKL